MSATSTKGAAKLYKDLACRVERGRDRGLIYDLPNPYYIQLLEVIDPETLLSEMTTGLQATTLCFMAAIVEAGDA